MIEAIPTSPSEWQAKVLAFRRHCNIFNGGPRGTGKSVSAIFDALDHAVEYGPASSGLTTRESHTGLQEIMGRYYQMAQVVFGSGTSMNKSEGIVTNPNGSVMAFTNISDQESFAKHQGKSRTLMIWDEVGNYLPTSVQFLNMLRSNLRGPKGVRTHLHLTANPRGRNHTWCVKNFVNRAAPFVPFREGGDGDFWVVAHAPSPAVNPFIDAKAYIRQLRAATAHDPALQRAWELGDWNASASGLMFADVFDAETHLRKPPRMRMRYMVGSDWGTASPATALLLGEILDPMGMYRPGDVCVLDSVDTCPGDDWSQGDGSSPAQFATQIREMLVRNGCKLGTTLVTDDARGLASETVIGLYRDAGLNAEKPRYKDRVGGWNLIRQMLHAAKMGERRGLFINPDCRALVETLLDAPRDDKRPEDLLRTWAFDHHLDGLQYGLRELTTSAGSGVGKVVGAW